MRANTTVILCHYIVLFSYSNCTGRGQGWPCCVPNYLRTFPKIATETSLHVRLQISPDIHLLFLPSHALCIPLTVSVPLFLYMMSHHLWSLLLSPSADDATRVILKSADDYINANYINVSVFLWVSPLCVVGGVLDGLFYLSRHMFNHCGCHAGEWTKHNNGENCLIWFWIKLRTAYGL